MSKLEFRRASLSECILSYASIHIKVRQYILRSSLVNKIVEYCADVSCRGQFSVAQETRFKLNASDGPVMSLNTVFIVIA